MQIICLGDSITDCNHLFEDFPLGNGYVQILSEMFRNQTPSFSISADTVRRSSSAVQLTDKSTGAIHFRNCGIDGFTVTRVLENIRQHRILLHHCSGFLCIFLHTEHLPVPPHKQHPRNYR